MRPILLLFVTVLFAMPNSAQKQLQITYENNTYGFRNIRSSKVKIISTKEVCLSTWEDLWYEMVRSGKGRNMRSELGTESKIITRYHFKDYRNNMLYYSDEKLFECFIKEEQKQFKWEIGNEQKEILGYNCTKATAHYRGRDYIAWFTTQLPFKAAPWKYHGLPGVILKVKSVDDFTYMTAIELKITDGKIPENPFRKKKLISWEEFTELYKEKLLVNYERFKANNARSGVFYTGANRPRIEIICSFNKLTKNKKERWNQRLNNSENEKVKL